MRKRARGTEQQRQSAMRSVASSKIATPYPRTVKRRRCEQFKALRVPRREFTLRKRARGTEQQRRNAKYIRRFTISRGGASSLSPTPVPCATHRFCRGHRYAIRREQLNPCILAGGYIADIPTYYPKSFRPPKTTC